MRSPARLVLLVGTILVLLVPSSCAQQPTAPWRYTLRPGDHLTYSEAVSRKTDGQSTQIETRLTTTNHVIVIADLADGIAVGVQRNREAGELLSYRENGKDKLVTERPKFADRIAQKNPRLAEINWFSLDGTPQLPWLAVRESSSRVLLGLHELESLPESSVKIGDQWRSNNPLGLRFRYVRDELVGTDSCHVAEADAHDIHLRYWFCPSLGAIAKSEMEADYITFAGRVHEFSTLTLKKFQHGQSTSQWLSDDNTQLAVLRMLQVTPSIGTKTEELKPLLESGSLDTQALTLAVLAQRNSVPSQVAKLSGTDPRIQRLTVKREATDPACKPLNASQHKMQVPGATVRYINEGSYRGTPYVLRIPDDYTPTGPGFPLLVYLSGGPGIALDAANGAEDVLSKTDYIVLYPNAAGEMWWTKDQASRVRALLDEVLPRLNIDPARVYLSGFSNGGTGALYFATLWPDQFSAVAPLMGAGNCLEDIRPLALNKLSKVPILFVHGDRDLIIPSSCSEDTYKAARKYSPASELHILKDHEHEIVLGNDGGLTLPFLQAHPRCVALK